ncbi:MAG: bifunctional phosphopantothenoylcysteine decarboxylase/phosphopantothenate--cysteine ligase CoaBC [Flavobacteriales bacterium]|nr:bifunctional phosphopantothenoylcysteine decarboxylase/phosphopantothenate--cysteine ligase CoaBC [Flavobacteriales bacterium]|tara:strand:+ start:1968 stop:3170 length:1203 start_codon:yes stop_codon:yes gene_type:complete
MLHGKNILIGITGGIAAYKAVEIVRHFIKKGAFVKCVLTPAAKDFISPLVLSTLSRNEVFSSFTSEEENPRWNNHVQLGIWADLMIIAPATANTLSKMCQGTCDNILLATYLSAKCQVYFAPAMDLDMYRHPSTIKNIDTLKSFGNIEIPVETGELASGLCGKGRMAEPSTICSAVQEDLLKKLPLRNSKVLITAGPTYEAIDPVRFIGNRSSGKMGAALALNFANKGAKVSLVLGPSAEDPKHQNIITYRVESAKQMFDKVMALFNESTIVVCSAAVADYAPEQIFISKIKNTQKNIKIHLNKTKDILSTLGKMKKKQFLIGFALETDNGIEEAKRKVLEKKLDLIVLNSLQDAGAGFHYDTNKITLINKNNKIFKFELKSKQEVAEDIIQHLLTEINA